MQMVLMFHTEMLHSGCASQGKHVVGRAEPPVVGVKVDSKRAEAAPLREGLSEELDRSRLHQVPRSKRPTARAVDSKLIGVTDIRRVEEADSLEPSARGQLKDGPEDIRGAQGPGHRVGRHGVWLALDAVDLLTHPSIADLSREIRGVREERRVEIAAPPARGPVDDAIVGRGVGNAAT